MKWTTAIELRNQIKRFWERGLVLRSVLSEEPVFPKRLSLKGPSSDDLTHSFADVRDWCNSLSKMSNVRLVYREINHRVIGTNTLPREAWLDSAEDAVKLLGKTSEWEHFNKIIKTIAQRRPEVLPWVKEHPLDALKVSGEWEHYLDIVDWMVINFRPGCYLRQVDLPGIHTKFIESNRQLLSKLFELALPPEAIETAFTGQSGFCRRYGFREKPERVRFRVLDQKLNPLRIHREADITLDINTFAILEQTPKHLFITENETNFLAFPKVANSWIIFGAGYGHSILKQVPWMNNCHIYYWGDIDTHGFAILDELRSVFPDAKSFLMDGATLLAHQNFWDTEPKPCNRLLPRLTKEETTLYQDLQSDRYGTRIRLEQERVSFSFVLEILSAFEFEIL